jgi:hypothetical protein
MYVDGFNRYGYVRQNPIGRIDPSGARSLAVLTTGGSDQSPCEGIPEPSVYWGVRTANRDILIAEQSEMEVRIVGDWRRHDGTTVKLDTTFKFTPETNETIAAFKCNCDSASAKCAEFSGGISDQFSVGKKSVALGIATLNFPTVKFCNIGKPFSENVASTIFHEWVHFSVLHKSKGSVPVMTWDQAPAGGFKGIDEWVARAAENRVYGSSISRDRD